MSDETNPAYRQKLKSLTDRGFLFAGILTVTETGKQTGVLLHHVDDLTRLVALTYDGRVGWLSPDDEGKVADAD